MDQSTATFIAACVAAVAAVAAALLAFAGARRTNYSNTIVATRIKWIAELRDDFSALYSDAEHILDANYDSPSEESLKLSKSYLTASLRLRLKLNPREDAEILLLVTRLEQAAYSACRGEDWNNVDRDMLIPLIQSLLKQEWDKSKREAKSLW